MTRFTEDQWELDTDSGDIRAKGHLVAKVYGATTHNYEPNATECFANARLIQKAPVLYHILKPLFAPKTEHKFSELVSAMREVQKVIEAIDTDGGKSMTEGVHAQRP